MKEVEVQIVHAANISVSVKTEPHIFVAHDYLYFLVPNEKGQHAFVKYGRSVEQAEKMMNEWIRKYENVLTGLKYWRSRALSK